MAHLTASELQHARLHGEETLVAILTELGGAVMISLRTDGVPQRFQTFWPDERGNRPYSGCCPEHPRTDYDARAHANMIP